MADVDIHRFADEAIRGGALLPDSKSEPLEFRCTERLMPTSLQQILWGDRLQAPNQEDDLKKFKSNLNEKNTMKNQKFFGALSNGGVWLS